MKTQRITINKTQDRPQGIDVDIVVPENQVEERLLSFLLPSLLRELKAAGRVNYEFPQAFKVDYRSEGTFLASDLTLNTAYYEPPKPIAIFGIRYENGRFDLIHAPAIPTPRQPQQGQQPAQEAVQQAAPPEPPPAEAQPPAETPPPENPPA